ncbi:hypothetical protein AB5I41_08980 [Sphingomonas sp. MMS24-JH45]
MTLDDKGAVSTWEAMPWLAGGTAAIRLARPGDAGLVAKVRGVLATMAADPAFRIARILDRADCPVRAARTRRASSSR